MDKDGPANMKWPITLKRFIELQEKELGRPVSKEIRALFADIVPQLNSLYAAGRRVETRPIVKFILRCMDGAAATRSRKGKRLYDVLINWGVIAWRNGAKDAGRWEETQAKVDAEAAALDGEDQNRRRTPTKRPARRAGGKET